MTNTRPFRFGAVTPLLTDVRTWQRQVSQIADLGFDTLLVPDVPRWQPAPEPMLAMAATIANIRVGTWVYASAIRPVWNMAFGAHALSVLTEGRFEMGIGVGRPDIESELHELGLPPDNPADRLTRIRDTVALLREIDGPDLHTPVAMAAFGHKGLSVAAEVANTVTFAMMPGFSREAVTQRVHEFTPKRDIELSQHVAVVGDTIAPFMTNPDRDIEALRAADSLEYLPSDPIAAEEELLRRREELGFSYFVFGAGVAEALAPVIARLSGT